MKRGEGECVSVKEERDYRELSYVATLRGRAESVGDLCETPYRAEVESR